MLKPAVFFDRDGVLNVEKGYVYKISDFEWVEGAKEAIKYLNEAHYLIFVVTNQSGISKNLLNWSDYHNVINKILEEVFKDFEDLFPSPLSDKDINDLIR